MSVDGDRPATPARKGRWRRVAGRLAICVAAYLVYGVLAFLLFSVDEGAVPSASSLPDLPNGLAAVEDEVGCGSGGCSRGFFLRSGDGWAPGELAATQDQLNGCGLPNPLTVRKVCVEVFRDLGSGGVVRLSLTYERPWY